jgi:hypothetical protein
LAPVQPTSAPGVLSLGNLLIAGMRVAYIHTHITIVHAAKTTTGFNISACSIDHSPL